MENAEQILNAYDAWRSQCLAAPADVSVRAYLSNLRTEAVGDLCADLYTHLNAGTLDDAPLDKWLAVLADAGFGE